MQIWSFISLRIANLRRNVDDFTAEKIELRANKPDAEKLSPGWLTYRALSAI